MFDYDPAAAAERLTGYIDYAERFYLVEDRNVFTSLINTAVSTIAELARGSANILKVGTGAAQGVEQVRDAEDGWDLAIGTSRILVDAGEVAGAAAAVAGTTARAAKVARRAAAAETAHATPSTLKPLRYKLKAQDLDWRGTGKTSAEAIEEGFRRTGVPKEEFEVSQWAKDAHGKSKPVEWGAEGGAEVNLDGAHPETTPQRGPDAPHVGWQSRGKRSSGQASRGHIILDDVPANRIKR